MTEMKNKSMIFNLYQFKNQKTDFSGFSSTSDGLGETYTHVFQNLFFFALPINSSLILTAESKISSSSFKAVPSFENF